MEPSQSPESITLSYVIPAHNSTSVIEATLNALRRRLMGRSAEILVVENGSTDGTARLLQKIEASWPPLEVPLVVLSSAKGLGNAYRAGIDASRGSRVVLTADDLPFGFDDLDAADGLDVDAFPVVIGSKGHRESDVDRGMLRWLLSWGFCVLRRVVLGMRTLDPQGTVILAGEWARAVVPLLGETGYLMTTELCYLAERAGISPTEVPVSLVTGHGDHRSRIHLRDVWHMAVGLIGIRRRHADATMNIAAREIRRTGEPRGPERSGPIRAPGRPALPSRMARSGWRLTR
jgi:hypothetical protein